MITTAADFGSHFGSIIELELFAHLIIFILHMLGLVSDTIHLCGWSFYGKCPIAVEKKLMRSKCSEYGEVKWEGSCRKNTKNAEAKRRWCKKKSTEVNFWCGVATKKKLVQIPPRNSEVRETKIFWIFSESKLLNFLLITLNTFIFVHLQALPSLDASQFIERLIR